MSSPRQLCARHWEKMCASSNTKYLQATFVHRPYWRQILDSLAQVSSQIHAPMYTNSVFQACLLWKNTFTGHRLVRGQPGEPLPDKRPIVIKDSRVLVLFVVTSTIINTSQTPNNNRGGTSTIHQAFEARSASLSRLKSNIEH